MLLALGRARAPGGTFVLGLLMLASFVMSLVLANALFPLYSINHDDAMYVYEARLLGDGHLTLPADDQDALRPWASGVRGDRVVMKYSPPWPATLAAGEWLTGSWLVAPAATAAAAVGLVYLLAREIWPNRRRLPLVAAAVFALSPLTLIQSGTFLPYLFQLVTGLAFAVCLLAGLRRRLVATGSTGPAGSAGSAGSAASTRSTRSAWLLMLSGLAFGVGLFARPFDAVLFALPFVAVLLWRLHDQRAVLARTLGLVACGAAPIVALSMLYNAHTMGNPLDLPFTVTGPYDTLGFGRRGVFDDTTFDFSANQGLKGLLTNLRWFPSWSFGGIVTFVCAGIALLTAVRSGGWRRTPWLWAVAGLIVTFFAGYVFFWSPFSMSRRWPGVETLGPFYHLAVLVPVALLGALGFDILWRTAPRRRLLGLSAVGLGVVLTAVALPSKIEANADIQDDHRARDLQIDELGLTHAVLVLPARGNDGFRSPTPFLENRPDLDQPVLYAEDRQAENLALFDRFPDREIVQLVQQVEPGDDLLAPSLVPTPLRLDSGDELTLDLTLTNPTDRDHVVAYISDGHAHRSRRLDDSSESGADQATSWSLAGREPPSSSNGSSGPSPFVPRETDAGMLRVGFAVADHELADVTDSDQRWELRLPYRIVDGEIQVIRPGQTYELFAYGGERHWIPKNLEGLLH